MSKKANEEKDENWLSVECLFDLITYDHAIVQS